MLFGDFAFFFEIIVVFVDLFVFGILVVIFVLPPIGDRTSVYSRPRYQMIRSAKK